MLSSVVALWFSNINSELASFLCAALSQKSQYSLPSVPSVSFGQHFDPFQIRHQPASPWPQTHPYLNNRCSCYGWIGCSAWVQLKVTGWTILTPDLRSEKTKETLTTSHPQKWKMHHVLAEILLKPHKLETR